MPESKNIGRTALGATDICFAIMNDFRKVILQARECPLNTRADP